MTPLVLVHGFMGGSAQWDGLIQRLTAREIVALDLPGFGAHAELAPIDRIEAFADWVIAQICDRGISRYHLLGHSMGGMIAQEIARRDSARIDRLVLYATGAIGVLPGRFETIAESKRRASVDGPQATARRIAATWFREQDAAAAFPHCAQIAQRASLAAIHAGLDAMQAWSGQHLLPDIVQQTLILWGDKDRTYSREQTEILRTAIPNATLKIFAGCAHAIHLEAPDLFAAHLADHFAPTQPSQHRPHRRQDTM